MTETARELLIPAQRDEEDAAWNRLLEIAQNAGIAVYLTKRLNPTNVQGMLCTVSPDRKVAVIAEDLKPGEKALVLAHELAHWMLGHLNDASIERFFTGDRDRREEEADWFAAVLLAGPGRECVLPASQTELGPDFERKEV